MEAEESDTGTFYEVERILSHKIDLRKNELMFLIKWKGYSDKDATWEQFESFAKDTPSLVKSYIFGFFDEKGQIVSKNSNFVMFLESINITQGKNR